MLYWGSAAGTDMEDVIVSENPIKNFYYTERFSREKDEQQTKT
jgi:hypothetical protein